MIVLFRRVIITTWTREFLTSDGKLTSSLSTGLFLVFVHCSSTSSVLKAMQLLKYHRGGT